MTYAICIKCGQAKRHPSNVCPECGLDPKLTTDDWAKSVILSTLHTDKDEEPARTKSDLMLIATQLKNGIPYAYDSADIERYRQLKREALGPWTRADKVQTIRWCVGFAAIVIVPWLIVILLKLLRK